MMINSVLDQLRQANPDLKLFSVEDVEFAPYGQVLDWADTEALSLALDETPIPESGNQYSRSVPALEALDVLAEVQSCVFGTMPVEAGTCNGHGFTLNAMEYHKCSEVNFTTTGLVLLLALPGDIKDGKLNSGDVVGFYLPAGVLVEIYPRVMHFAPCRISEEGFRCLVVLENGTNEALAQVDTNAHGEQALLWMVNKWMICHPDSPQAQKGAYQGITGENIQLKL